MVVPFRIETSADLGVDALVELRANQRRPPSVKGVAHVRLVSSAPEHDRRMVSEASHQILGQLRPAIVLFPTWFEFAPW